MAAVLALQIATVAVPSGLGHSNYDATLAAPGGAFDPTLRLADSPRQVLNNALPPAISRATDRYGGRTDISCTSRPGKWHTEKIATRWWICTPAGHAFWKQSLYVIGHGDAVSIGAKYGSVANYNTAVLNRIKAWGFNTIDLGVQGGAWGIYPTASPAPGVLVPFIFSGTPNYGEKGAMSAYPSLDWDDGRRHPVLTYNVKNIWGAMPASYYRYSPWMPPQADLMDPGVAAQLAYSLHRDKQWQSIAASPNASYLMGVSVDDGDDMWGFMGGECCGNTASVPHLGWVSLASSPIVNAGALNVYGTTNQQFLYYDPQHKSKAALLAFLQTKYGSINALNAAWGSHYTQWNSAGTPIAGERIATGDESAAAYTATLAHATPSRYSIAVTVNGTVVAGDMSHDRGNGNADPNNPADGRIWGPYVSGTIAYGSRLLSVAFATAHNTPAGPRTIAQISASHNLVTVDTLYQHGLWTGAYVAISGTDRYNSPKVGPIAVLDAFHFTYAAARTLPAENNKGTYALYATPGPGDAIAVNYVVNGWEIGSGFMDEANNHSWSNGDGHAANTSALPPQMKADLDAYLYRMAYTYYHNYEQLIHSVFPNAMYVGHDAVNGNLPPHGPILKAAGQVVDVLTTGYRQPYSQTALDYIYASYGDRPIFDSFYATTNLDSPAMSATKPDTLPHYHSQEEKGRAYYTRMRATLNAAYSANGSHPYVGMGVWSYLDMNDGSGYRWGLVTRNDNAYDGHEAAPGSKPCSPPLSAYTCVAETPYTIPTWQPGIYLLGPDDNRWYHVIANVGGAYYIFETTKGGSTGRVQPTWCSNLNCTVADGGQTWKNIGVWSKAANPGNYGDAITQIRIANAMWLNVTQ
jgi:hypothetical protein